MLTDHSLPRSVDEAVHGLMVTDPYRWLEDRDSRYTETWLACQRELHDTYFSEVRGIDALRTRVECFLRMESLDQPAQVGNRFFYRRRTKDSEQACICVQDIPTGRERLLVDPSSGGPFASVHIHWISHDGSLLAYERKYGGSDAKAIHFVEVATGSTLDDHIEVGVARGLTFAPEKDGVYYCHESGRNAGGHVIRFHRFGHRINDDVEIFGVPSSPRSRLLLAADEHHLGAIHFYQGRGGTVLDFYLATRTNDRHWRLILKGRMPPYAPFLRDGRIFALTTRGTSGNAIVEEDSSGNVMREVVPAWETEIRQVVIADGTIYARYLLNGRSVIRSWTISGQYAGDVRVPDDGSVQLLASCSAVAKTFFYSHESFTEPTRIFQYFPTTGRSSLWHSPFATETFARFRVEKVSYPASDGRRIPISLVTRKDSNPHGERPAIMTGYGGFGVAMTPRFSVLVAILVDLGALFALPEIRGGSEFGAAWHEAARGQRRQVAIDDFLAAAEWLCKQSLTSPQKLAIFGGSNSGLLVGAAMVQRPNLFRAVLCIAPLLDMVRYEQLDPLRNWQHEYGTAEDPEDFLALRAYSPYHNVRENLDYPSTLFVSGDQDERCNPAHARKMAARLQAARTQKNPILLDYSQERGHSPTLPLSVRVESLTRRIAFLCKELGIEVPSEVPDEPLHP